MPEPEAVFYLLQFPTNFLCGPRSDLSLTGDLLCLVVDPDCLAGECGVTAPRVCRESVCVCFLGGRESNIVLLNIFSLHTIFHKILLSHSIVRLFI